MKGLFQELKEHPGRVKLLISVDSEKVTPRHMPAFAPPATTLVFEHRYVIHKATDVAVTCSLSFNRVWYKMDIPYDAILAAKVERFDNCNDNTPTDNVVSLKEWKEKQ